MFISEMDETAGQCIQSWIREFEKSEPINGIGLKFEMIWNFENVETQTKIPHR